MWRASLFTIFPEMFPGPLGCSLAGKSLAKGIWELDVINIRDYALDKHSSVDERPFGGGSGMVMRPDVLANAIENLPTKPDKLIYFTPRGKLLDNQKIHQLTSLKHVAILCGRFEGVDERLLNEYDFDEISVGDYILSGGEVAAMLMLDACVRLLPGVIQGDSALLEESFACESEFEFLLEYPHYTRPNLWKGREVPEVLLSGNHEQIRKWRFERAKEITKERRPDLWERYLQINGKKL